MDTMLKRKLSMVPSVRINGVNNNKNNNIYRGSPIRQGGFQWGPHVLI